MFVPKRKLTQLFFIISTFTRFAKLAKIEVDFNANNYFLGFQGAFAKSPKISAQNQQEMESLSSISENGIGMLGYLYLGALKDLESRKIKISKGSLHLFWVFLYAEECQKSGSSCLFVKNPLGLFTNDEDIEYTLPSSSESSMFLGEVKFSGAINESYFRKLYSENGCIEDLDFSVNSQMVLLRGMKMDVTLVNGQQTKHKDGTYSLVLDKSLNTRLRLSSPNLNITMIDMGLTNRVTGDVLDKAIKFTLPEEFDEDDGDIESGRRGKDINDDGKGADGKPQDESLFSKPIFWVITSISVGLVLSFVGKLPK